MRGTSARLLVALRGDCGLIGDRVKLDGNSARCSIGLTDAPVAVCPVRRVTGAPFRMATYPGEALSSHISNAVSEYMRAACVAGAAVRCGYSLQGGDGSFEVGVYTRAWWLMHTAVTSTSSSAV